MMKFESWLDSQRVEVVGDHFAALQETKRENIALDPIKSARVENFL